MVTFYAKKKLLLQSAVLLKTRRAWFIWLYLVYMLMRLVVCAGEEASNKQHGVIKGLQAHESQRSSP